EGGRVAVQVVPLGTEMVVDDVEEDGEPAGVTGFHERLEGLRPPVAALRREGENAIIAPPATSGEIRHGHELHGRHSERDEVVESVGEAGEGAFGAERPDVDLVEDETLGGQTAPVAIGPGIVEGADDLAGPVDVVRLEAGGGIGHEQVAVDPERVAG